MPPLIYIQKPKPDALKVLKDELKKLEGFEKFFPGPSFRVELLKELIKKCEG